MIILAYATNITSIPESLILFENEEMNFEAILGIKLEETIAVGAEISEQETSNLKPQTSEN